MGNMTPIMLTALDGLLKNEALDINTELRNAWNSYRQNPSLSELRSKLVELFSLPEVPNSDDADLNSAVTAIQSIRALSDFYGASAGGYVPFSEHFADWMVAQIGLSYGKNRRFVATLQHISTYVNETNKAINSAVNSPDVAKYTFTDMDDLLTGNITLICSNPELFGEDLLKTGSVIDFSNLRNYGTPDALIRTLVKTGAIVFLEELLRAVNIEVTDISSAVANTDTPMALPIQKIIYDSVLTQANGQVLNDIKDIMGVTTSGISTLADFLSTAKLFPNSFNTLRTMVDGRVVPLSSGITANLMDSKPLSVINDNDAKINYAFSVALQQIKNIASSTPSKLANQALTIETNIGLTSIEALNEPIDDVTIDSLTASIAVGSGPNGTLYVTDAMGLLCNINPHEVIFFQEISANTYDFSNLISAIDALIAKNGLFAGAELAAFIAACNSIEVRYHQYWAVANGYLDELVAQIASEKAIFVAADINLYQETISTQGLNGFVGGIHSIATKTDKGNIVEVLEKLATPVKSGQAIIAALREGRNLERLARANILTDTTTSDTPTVTEPGDLLPSSP